jgi:hypothetical protein
LPYENTTALKSKQGNNAGSLGFLYSI